MYHNALERRCNGCWEDEGHHFLFLLRFLLLPPAPRAEPLLHNMEYPFGQLSQLCVYPHTASCAAPDSSVARGGKKQERLWLCKPCTAITKTSLCYRLCSQHKCKSQPHSSYGRERELRPKLAWCTATQTCPNTQMSNRCSIQVLHSLGTS